MRVPFTADEFFGVFAAYNAAVWPAQWLLVGLAVVAVGAAFVDVGRSSRWVTAILVLFWLWMGLVYHLAHFRAINPGATLFGAAFVLQAGLFGWAGVRGRLAFGPRRDAHGLVGGVLIVYALVVYPLLNSVLGHRYPAAPTFGAPCPTTILTFGLLLWTERRVPWWLLIVPGLWAVVGLSAALSVGVPQDIGLFVAGAVAIPMLLFHRRRPDEPSGGRAAPAEQRVGSIARG